MLPALLSSLLVALPSASVHAPPVPDVRHAPRVWTVDACGAGDFTEIGPAIRAAASGDSICVRPRNEGAYLGFVVEGKGVTIFGEDAHRPQISGRILVRHIPENASVVLRALEIGDIPPAPFPMLPALDVSDAAGSVRIERCQLSYASGAQGVRTTDCASVTLVDTNVLQRERVSPERTDDHALYCLRSNVQLLNGVFQGRVGPPAEASAQKPIGEPIGAAQSSGSDGSLVFVRPDGLEALPTSALTPVRDPLLVSGFVPGHANGTERHPCCLRREHASLGRPARLAWRVSAAVRGARSGSSPRVE